MNSIPTILTVLGVVLVFAGIVWFKSGPTISREQKAARELDERIHRSSTTTEGTHLS